MRDRNAVERERERNKKHVTKRIKVGRAKKKTNDMIDGKASHFFLCCDSASFVSTHGLIEFVYEWTTLSLAQSPLY